MSKFDRPSKHLVKKGLSLFALLILLAVNLNLVHAASASMPGIQELVPDGAILSEFDQFVSQWTLKPSKPIQLEVVNPDTQEKKVVYLTFDDGPDPEWTPQVVEMLEKYNAKATFYVIGKSAKSNADTILLMAQAGQNIANHSYNHISLAALSWTDFYLEVKDTELAVREALVDYPDLEKQIVSCVRPPYGETSPNIWTFASRMHYDVSMWSLDTRDWSGVSAETIRETVLANVKPESIILMHDGGKNRAETVRGLGLLLHELIRQGYTFESYCTTDGQVRVGQN